MKKITWVAISLCLLGLLVSLEPATAKQSSWAYQSLAPLNQTPAITSTSTPNSTISSQMAPISPRLAPPPTVYPPTQADQGAQVYYLVCMACHGDRGQGLTDEWRQVIGPPDQNCWQSHCHGTGHPDAFMLPHNVPAIIRSGLLTQFQSASALHAFIQSKMPYQAPGTLTDAEYWQLTAFLLRANGVELKFAILDEQTAQQISLVNTTTLPTPKPISFLIAIILIGIFVLILVTILLIYLRKKRI